ncbi:MAG TPA: transglutaminase, partial [Ruminococcaceae bacterium]|nr:transglutaminase [Oscillospiraceae bacterium]
VAATHSWNEVYLQGKGWITIKIQNTAAGWKLMDATFGASNSTAKSYTAARVY